jgi:hypothetical protein
MVAVGVAGLGSTHANGAQRPARFPAAGDLVNNTLVIRAAPSKRARVVRVLHEFRKDFRLQIVLALRQVKIRHARWVELRTGTARAGPHPYEVVVGELDLLEGDAALERVQRGARPARQSQARTSRHELAMRPPARSS